MFYEGLFWPEVEDLILGMMQKEHEDRLTLNEIMGHKFWTLVDPREEVPSFEEIEKLYTQDERDLMRVILFFPLKLKFLDSESIKRWE
jgi:hypothetical protein